MSTLLWLLTEAGLVLCWLVTPWAPAPVAGPVLADGAAGGLACTAADKEAVAGTAHLPRDGGEG